MDSDLPQKNLKRIMVRDGMTWGRGLMMWGRGLMMRGRGLMMRGRGLMLIFHLEGYE